MNWYWFIASQVVYGVAMSIVVINSEKVPAAPGGERAGPVGGRSGVRPAWRSVVKSSGISKRRSWTLLALLAGCVTGCDLPGRPRAGDRYIPPRDEKTFDALFRRSCVGCHGADGKLGPAPPLNDRLFLALVPDAELRRVIAEGRPGTLMPAFATASGGELDGRAGGHPGKRYQDAMGTGRARHQARRFRSAREVPSLAAPSPETRKQGPRGLRPWPAPPATAMEWAASLAASRPAAINDPTSWP